MSQICKVCGVYAVLKCGGCKIVVYCGKDHQKSDWKNGHKNQCKCYEVNICDPKKNLKICISPVETNLFVT